MVLSTTDSLDGTSVNEYLGIVVGEGVIGGHVVSAMSSSVSETDGRGPGSYEMDLKRAKNSAMDTLKEQAAKLGANGVLGIDVDYISAGKDGSMLMVIATGTAVKLG